MDNFPSGYLSDKLNEEIYLTVERIRYKLVEEIKIQNTNQVVCFFLEWQIRIYRKCNEQNRGQFLV